MIVDHTFIAEHGKGGVFLASAIGAYSRARKVLVIPLPSLLAAAGSATTPAARARISWLLSPQLSAVIRLQEVEEDDARAMLDLPVLAAGEGLEWAAWAPVVWTAQRLEVPVLTLNGKVYEAYGIAYRGLP